MSIKEFNTLKIGGFNMTDYERLRKSAKYFENAIKEKYTRDGYNVHTCDIYANGGLDNFDIYVELSKPEKAFYKFIRGTYTRDEIKNIFGLKGV